jgi:hypothetical protein
VLVCFRFQVLYGLRGLKKKFDEVVSYCLIEFDNV